MSYRPPTSPGIVLARLLLASVFLVMGGWRLWGAYQGVPTTGATLSFSVAELILGVLVAAAWRLRAMALLAAALLVVDAVLSHPFWALGGAARTAQLLHFMKNVGLAGGFLLLSSLAPASRRR